MEHMWIEEIDNFPRMGACFGDMICEKKCSQEESSLFWLTPIDKLILMGRVSVKQKRKFARSQLLCEDRVEVHISLILINEDDRKSKCCMPVESKSINLRSKLDSRSR